MPHSDEAEPQLPEPEPEPEPEPPAAAGRFRLACDAVVRGGCEKGSVRLGELRRGAELTELRQVDSSDEEEQAAAAEATVGWISFVAGDGTPILEALAQPAAAGSAAVAAIERQ